MFPLLPSLSSDNVQFHLIFKLESTQRDRKNNERKKNGEKRKRIIINKTSFLGVFFSRLMMVIQKNEDETSEA